MFAGPPVSTSIDFDESVFGPLHRRVDTNNDIQPARKRSELPPPASLNTTRYNESVLAPILATRKEGKKGMVERELESPRRSSSSRLDMTQFNESVLAPIRAAKKMDKGKTESLEGAGSSNNLSTDDGVKRKRSTFEIMMESLEQSCEHEKTERNVTKQHQQVVAPPPPATFVPSHASYKCKEPCLPTSGEILTSTASEGNFDGLFTISVDTSGPYRSKRKILFHIQ